MLDSPTTSKKSGDIWKNDTNLESFITCGYSLNLKTDFSNCRLREFSTSLEALKFTESLNLSRNQITNLPSRVKEYRLLTSLNLSFNKIFSLPSCICELSSLRTLLISNNFLSSLPSDVCKLNYLQEIDLSFNRITDFPASLSSLSSLKVLILCNNLITDLPEEISDFRHLKILDLRSNKLKRLPLNLRLMWCLERLSLEENPLSSPPITIVARGIPYIFAFLSQQAQWNSDNITSEKYHDSLNDSSTPKTNTIKPSITEKVTSRPFSNQNVQKYESVVDCTQKSLAEHEITSRPPTPSTTREFTYTSTNIVKAEQLKNKGNNMCSNDCVTVEESPVQTKNRNKSLSSYRNEKSKSVSSISSLSTDEEPLTMNLYYSADENMVFEKKKSTNESLKLHTPQQVEKTIKELIIENPPSACNVNTATPILSIISNENDAVSSKSSIVERVNSYVNENESSSSSAEEIISDHTKDSTTKHMSGKYDRRVKAGRLTSSSRFRSSKRQQMVPDEFLNSDASRISHSSQYSGKYSIPHRSPSRCPNVPSNTNQMYYYKDSCHSHKTAADKNNCYDIARVGVAMYIPTEPIIKSPPPNYSSNGLQKINKCHLNSNISSAAVFVSKNNDTKTENKRMNSPGRLELNKFDHIIKWEELYPEELNKIHQLRRIIDKELNIRLPVNPKHLAIELSTGVILIHFVNKFIGAASKIKVCSPRNDQTNMLSEVMKSYRRNIRRCREWLHLYGVPREYLFSTESIVNPNSANGLLSLANCIFITYNLRESKFSNHLSTQNNTPVSCQYNNTDSLQSNSKVQSTSSTNNDTKMNNHKVYEISNWPHHLCSDV
ncbi:unnamed protein product [Trichobilharzia szidati]|nr:unnamed protein product [Trichobilharzia szidati]